MKRSLFVALALCLALLLIGAVALADTDGDFTYSGTSSATINGYTGSSADLVIPDAVNGIPVTAIGSKAFQNNTTIETVIVPDTVETLGTYAFSGCTSLTGVTISGNVAAIPGRAFYGCSSLTDVALPDSVTSIATSAFEGCAALKQLKLPADIDTVGNKAFPSDTLIVIEGYYTMTFDSIDGTWDCMEYEAESSTTAVICRGSAVGDTFTVPDTIAGYSISSTYSGAFSSGIKLIVDLTSNIAHELCNEGYVVYDPSDLTIGVTIYDGRVTLQSYDGTASQLTVPSFIQAIGNYAFSGNTTLAQVTLPSGVTSIGYSAFENTSLTSIDIPDGLTSISGDSLPSSCKPHATLGSKAGQALSDAGYTFYQPNDDIYGCRYIDGLLYLVQYDGTEDVITVPEGIEGVAYVFSVYNKMTKVEFPSTIKVIGTEAFKNCSGLTSITIPSTVEEIGYEAFAGSALRSISLPDNVKRVGYGAFQNCTQLASVTFVVSGKNGVSTIGDYAFCNTALRSVSIPTTTTTIGSYAFSGCSKLATLTLPESGSLATIGYSAFSSSAIKELTVPGTVQQIDGSFANCNSLEKVTLNSGIKVIGDDAFQSCGNLKEINIPSSVTTIGNSAFLDNFNLNSISLPNTVTSIGRSSFAFTNLSGGVKLSTKLTTISDYAFQSSQLTSIYIPDNVTTIGSGAFQSCSNLKDVRLSSNLTDIASGAFSYCSSMTWFELPATMKRLNQCLYNCTSAIVVLPDSITYIDGIALGDVRAVLGSRSNDILKSLNSFGYSDERSFIYTYIGDDGVEDFKTLRVVDYIGEVSEATLSGDVKIINDKAFYSCPKLKKLTLPDSGITKIGENAFHAQLQVICTNGSDTYKLLVKGGYPVEIDGYPGLYAVSKDGKLYDASYRGNASIIDLPDNIVSTDPCERSYDEYQGYYSTTPTHDTFPITTRYRTTFDSETAKTLGNRGYYITVKGFEDFGFKKNNYGTYYDNAGIPFSNAGNFDDYSPIDVWFLAHYYGKEKTVVLPNDFSYFYLNGIDAEVRFMPGTTIKSVGSDYNGDITFVGYEDFTFGYSSNENPISINYKDGGYDEVYGVYLKQYTGNASTIVMGNDFPARYALNNAIPDKVKVYCEPALSGYFRSLFESRSFFVPGYDDFELRNDGGPVCLYKYSGTAKSITIDEDFPAEYALENAIPSSVKVYCTIEAAANRYLFHDLSFFLPDNVNFEFRYGDDGITLINYTGTASEITLPAGDYPIKSGAFPASVKSIHVDDYTQVEYSMAYEMIDGSIKLFAEINSDFVKRAKDGYDRGPLYSTNYPDVAYYVEQCEIRLSGYTGTAKTIHLPGYFEKFAAGIEDYISTPNIYDEYDPETGEYHHVEEYPNPFDRPVYTIAGSKTAQLLDRYNIPYLTDDMTRASLPSALTAIEDEAFVKCRFNEVVVPSKCTSIGARAFANSTDLIAIHIPASVKSIDATAFANCVQVTIYCKKGSAAETFAKNNGISYVNE